MDLKTLITEQSTIEESKITVIFDNYESEEYILCSDEDDWYFTVGGIRYNNINMLDREVIGVEFHIAHNLNF